MSRALRMLLVVSVLTLAFAAAPAFAEQPEESEERPTHEAAASLTEQQKSELAAIYKDLFEKKKQLIAKYLEFGVISQEKANKWTDRLDAHYTKLEQNDFIPNDHKCGKDKKKERRNK